MAFGAKKIAPIDLKPSVGVGVGLPFNAPGVFRITYTTKEAIKNNLINFFLTNQPERYLNPNFGANLRAFIFQQIASENLDFLKQDIQQQINLYFPNVIIAELNIDSFPNTNTISVGLTYTILNTGISDSINLQFI